MTCDDISCDSASFFHYTYSSNILCPCARGFNLILKALPLSRHAHPLVDGRIVPTMIPPGASSARVPFAHKTAMKSSCSVVVFLRTYVPLYGSLNRQTISEHYLVGRTQKLRCLQLRVSLLPSKSAAAEVY